MSIFPIQPSDHSDELFGWRFLDVETHWMARDPTLMNTVYTLQGDKKKKNQCAADVIDWEWSCLIGTEMLNQQKKKRKKKSWTLWLIPAGNDESAAWRRRGGGGGGGQEEEEEEEAAFIPDENDCKLQTSLAHLKINKKQPFVCTRNEAYKRFSPVSTQTERWRGSAGTHYFPTVGQKLWNSGTAWGFCCGWISGLAGVGLRPPASC